MSLNALLLICSFSLPQMTTTGMNYFIYQMQSCGGFLCGSPIGVQSSTGQNYLAVCASQAGATFTQAICCAPPPPKVSSPPPVKKSPPPIKKSPPPIKKSPPPAKQPPMPPPQPTTVKYQFWVSAPVAGNVNVNVASITKVGLLRMHVLLACQQLPTLLLSLCFRLPARTCSRASLPQC